MLSGYERRPRIQPEEIPEVMEALRMRLWYHLDEGRSLDEASLVFRAYWRLCKNRVGKPDYPPLTWDSIKDYLVNGTIKREEGGAPQDEEDL